MVFKVKGNKLETNHVFTLRLVLDSPNSEDSFLDLFSFWNCLLFLNFFLDCCISWQFLCMLFSKKKKKKYYPCWNIEILKQTDKECWDSSRLKIYTIKIFFLIARESLEPLNILKTKFLSPSFGPLTEGCFFHYFTD